jgi:hypothetical protein
MRFTTLLHHVTVDPLLRFTKSMTTDSLLVRYTDITLKGDRWMATMDDATRKRVRAGRLMLAGKMLICAEPLSGICIEF